MKLKLCFQNHRNMKIIFQTIFFISILINLLLIFLLVNFKNNKTNNTFDANIYIEAVDNHSKSNNPTELFQHHISDNVETNYLMISCHLGDSISSILNNHFIKEHFLINESVYGKFVQDILDWNLQIYQKTSKQYWQLFDYNNEVQCSKKNNYQCNYGISDLKIVQHETYIKWELSNF